MTREELFRAVGEVREEQIAECETAVGKRWAGGRSFAALAACLILALAAGFALNRVDHSMEDIVPESTQVPEDAPAAPAYSTGAEIVEMREDTWAVNSPVARGDSENTSDSAPKYAPALDSAQTEASASCVKWLSAEEILAMETVIFRGTVQNLRYFQVSMDGQRQDYTVAAVEIGEVLRGDHLTAGDIYNVLYPGIRGLSTTSLSGALEQLETGSEGIFMPQVSASDTGWRSGDGFFCYADLSELYFSEGWRFLFLDTGDGLSFARNVYPELENAQTLDDVMSYLRTLVS